MQKWNCSNSDEITVLLWTAAEYHCVQKAAEIHLIKLGGKQTPSERGAVLMRACVFLNAFICLPVGDNTLQFRL